MAKKTYPSLLSAFISSLFDPGPALEVKDFFVSAYQTGAVILTFPFLSRNTVIDGWILIGSLSYLLVGTW
jgi:hypothetical protein